MRTLREGSSGKGSGPLQSMFGDEECCSQANAESKEGARTMHGMWEGPGRKDSEMRQVPTGQEKNGHQKRDEEGGMKATIPEGEHPFDYLFEGHQQLMAGCLLLEEIDPPL